MQRIDDKKSMKPDDQLMFQEDPLLVLRKKLQAQESLLDEMFGVVDLSVQDIEQLAVNMIDNMNDNTAAELRACVETSRQLNDAVQHHVNQNISEQAGQFARNEKYFELYGDYEINRNNLLIYLTTLLLLINTNYPETVESRIKIESGPINDAMKVMLNVAIESLQELNLENFMRVKSVYVNQYDLVRTRFSGVVSLGQRHVGMIGRLFDSGKNQPGFLVSEAIQQTELMLAELTKRFANLIERKREFNSRNI